VKGLFSEPISARWQLDRALDEGANTVLGIASGQPSRLTMRFIVPNDMHLPQNPNEFTRGSLHVLLNVSGWGGGIEASMDLGRVVPGHRMIYYGFNGPNRDATPNLSQLEIASAHEVATMSVAVSEDSFRRVRDAGFTIDAPLALSDAEVATITRLYQQAFPKYIFPLDNDSVGGFLRNPSNIALIARDVTGRPVSSLVAEHMLLSVGERTINFIEVSEAATDDDYRGNGLLTALYRKMIDVLHNGDGQGRSGYDPSNTIVYAESRAPWVPANVITRRGGGMDVCGLLVRHCTIVATRNPNMQYPGEFEDLVVWHLSSF